MQPYRLSADDTNSNEFNKMQKYDSNSLPGSPTYICKLMLTMIMVNTSTNTQDGSKSFGFFSFQVSVIKT